MQTAGSDTGPVGGDSLIAARASLVPVASWAVPGGVLGGKLEAGGADGPPSTVPPSPAAGSDGGVNQPNVAGEAEAPDSAGMPACECLAGDCIRTVATTRTGMRGGPYEPPVRLLEAASCP